jgi:hypothetical protein
LILAFDRGRTPPPPPFGDGVFSTTYVEKTL